MVNIVKIKNEYYIYDYNLDIKTLKYRKVYIGKATQEQYESYKGSLKDKSKNFCMVCGLRKKETLPKFIPEHKYVCKCSIDKTTTGGSI